MTAVADEVIVSNELYAMDQLPLQAAELVFVVRLQRHPSVHKRRTDGSRIDSSVLGVAGDFESWPDDHQSNYVELCLSVR